ncbi:FkbM family methyltransferase [Pseudomonas sp. NCCP-436]|uniref:FkbM family methyltransferase n=1 Tax=Pseudomonas sp. NCCP-436 TaxID=2842481 RepID=UPI001C808700|nr:FkbM family methyltransferase [Pseudomonas sp. NCCP-436]GIZ11941.1 hypothetical protein NCCP436_13570 [Pseudomonas sp. NCCP-436]
MKVKMKARLALKVLAGQAIPAEELEQHRTSQAEVERLAGRLRKWAYRAFQPPALDLAVATLAAALNGRGLSVVQVGANDGVTGDPVHHLIMAYAERVLLIEPQAMLLDKLRSNYSAFTGDLRILNQAVAAEGDQLTLHTLREDLHEQYIERVGRHPSAIASFNSAYVLEKVRDRLALDEAGAETAVVATQVPASRLDSLLVEHGYSHVDLLQIDCEGYDWKVLETLGSFRPTIINFESFNLSRDDWAAWVKWATANGYGFVQGHMDCLAIKGYPQKVSY